MYCKANTFLLYMLCKIQQKLLTNEPNYYFVGIDIRIYFFIMLHTSFVSIVAILCLSMFSSITALSQDQFNNGNRFLRWRKDNGLVATLVENNPIAGSEVSLSRNTDSIGQKWRFDSSDKSIIGVNDLCLGSKNDRVIVDTCENVKTNGISWHFDEAGRIVAVDEAIRCVEAVGQNGIAILGLRECSDNELQQFELEGAGVTAEFKDLSIKKDDDKVVDDNSETEKTPIIQNNEIDPQQFSTLFSLIESAGLNDMLNDRSYTVFAPNNEAFDALPTELVSALLKPANKEILAQILKYHIIRGNVSSSEVLNRKNVSTIEGSQLSISQVNGEVLINDDAKIIRLDKTFGKDTVHVIDRVLIPSTLNLNQLVDDNQTDMIENHGIEDNDVSETYDMNVYFPFNGVRLNGVQSFQVAIEGLEPNQYKSYWSVDNGQLNEMINIGNGKIGYVDFNDWSWLGEGPYSITLISFDLNGNLISEKTVQIYVPQF